MLEKLFFWRVELIWSIYQMIDYFGRSDQLICLKHDKWVSADWPQPFVCMIIPYWSDRHLIVVVLNWIDLGDYVVLPIQKQPWYYFMKSITPRLFWNPCQFVLLQVLYINVNWRWLVQCFPKVARVADHFNRVADQLPHFAKPNDPPNLNWGRGP